MNNSIDPKPFVIKAYGKSELAMRYCPDVDPHVAANRLRRWIVQTKGLLPALQQTGYNRHAHFFTPLQVSIIVSLLGEPPA